MPIYTDAMGKHIRVDSNDMSRPPTPRKGLMNTVTHLPPHKAAAMASSREASEAEDRENDTNNKQCPALNDSSANVVFQTVTPTTTEIPPASDSADIVTHQSSPTFGAHTPAKAHPVFQTAATGDRDPFAATLQAFSTMPPSPEPIPPHPTPRLSIDLSDIPAQQQTATPFKRPARINSESPSPVGNPKNAVLAYNQYGEIVRIKDMARPKDPATLTKVETLRLIEKVYGYDVSTAVTWRCGYGCLHETNAQYSIGLKWHGSSSCRWRRELTRTRTLRSRCRHQSVASLHGTMLTSQCLQALMHQTSKQRMCTTVHQEYSRLAAVMVHGALHQRSVTQSGSLKVWMILITGPRPDQISSSGKVPCHSFKKNRD